MRLRVRLSCFDKNKLNTIVQQFSSIFEKFGVKSSLISLPTKRKIWCLQQATFKFEDSKKHYERLTYSKVITIYNPEVMNMNLLSKFKVFPAIKVSIKALES